MKDSLMDKICGYSLISLYLFILIAFLSVGCIGKGPACPRRAFEATQRDTGNPSNQEEAGVCEENKK